MDNNIIKSRLIEYFKDGEKETKSFGLEIEHFVVRKEDFSTVSYEEGGIEDVLKELKVKGWQGVEEDGKLIGLMNDGADITLEPGGQFEIGISPQIGIENAKAIYFNFLEDLIPILEQKSYYLISLGYQVKSKIEDITWNSKARYRIMSEYLEKKGKYAHNMMKGTAALQLTFDYCNEEDFIKKFRIANTLSPVIAILLDNAPIFEGEIYKRNALRTEIWSNTDNERAGIIEDAFADDFGYEKYSEYILSRRPILIKSNQDYIATGERTNYKIFQEQEMTKSGLEHILTMVFPDVRVKQFIEIRMADSLPPRYIFAALALWKGLLYDSSSLEKTYEFINNFSLEDVLKSRKDIIEEGLQAKIGRYKILEVADNLLRWAELGLSEDEFNYLKPLYKLVENQETLADKVKSKLNLGKEIALNKHILNNLL